MAVSFDDLLLIIGTKEATIYQLQRQLGATLQELQQLKTAAAQAKLSNVLPFPSEASSGETE